MIEKRVSRNKEQLVQTTETAVQGSVVTYNSARSKEDDDDEDAGH